MTENLLRGRPFEANFFFIWVKNYVCIFMHIVFYFYKGEKYVYLQKWLHFHIFIFVQIFCKKYLGIICLCSQQSSLHRSTGERHGLHTGENKFSTTSRWQWFYLSLTATSKCLWGTTKRTLLLFISSHLPSLFYLIIFFLIPLHINHMQETGKHSQRCSSTTILKVDIC